MSISSLHRIATLAAAFCVIAAHVVAQEAQHSAGRNDTESLFRPMTSISLQSASQNQSTRGEPLQTPASQAEIVLHDIPPETHFTAAPWHRSHPPRNTFPVRYQPLYFEDPNLERCGQSAGCLTELTSVIHFGARIPALPYLMVSNCPHDCVRALPDCPTSASFGPDAYWPHPTAEATAVQIAATVGWLFVIP